MSPIHTFGIPVKIVESKIKVAMLRCCDVATFNLIYLTLLLPFLSALQGLEFLSSKIRI